MLKPEHYGRVKERKWFHCFEHGHVSHNNTSLTSLKIADNDDVQILVHGKFETYWELSYKAIIHMESLFLEQ
jgi:hypothetical protein